MQNVRLMRLIYYYIRTPEQYKSVKDDVERQNDEINLLLYEGVQ